MESFLNIPRVQHEGPWFGRSQYDVRKQNKLPCFWCFLFWQNFRKFQPEKYDINLCKGFYIEKYDLNSPDFKGTKIKSPDFNDKFQ
jgi:hypothetical protein